VPQNRVSAYPLTCQQFARQTLKRRVNRKTASRRLTTSPIALAIVPQTIVRVGFVHAESDMTHGAQDAPA